MIFTRFFLARPAVSSALRRDSSHTPHVWQCVLGFLLDMRPSPIAFPAGSPMAIAAATSGGLSHVDFDMHASKL